MKKADEIGMTTEAIQVRYEDNTREDFPIIKISRIEAMKKLEDHYAKIGHILNRIRGMRNLRNYEMEMELEEHFDMAMSLMNLVLIMVDFVLGE